MKCLLSVIIANLLLCCSLLSQESYIDRRQNTHLWGALSIEDLSIAPYDEWFLAADSLIIENHTAYDVQIQSLDEMTVKIFLGTWCGDTKMWLPRFIQRWTALGLSTDQLELIGLNQIDDRYKQGPNGEEKGWNIHRVPTFIFLKDEEEVGRIVERPNTDLLTDILQIDRGIPSTPRYQAVSTLIDSFQLHTEEEYSEQFSGLLRSIYRKVSTQSELNTYGYVLKAAGDLEKAKLVFQLNARLFAHEPNVHDSLGEIHMTLGDYEEAKKSYQKVLEIDPLNENAIHMLSKVMLHLQDLANR